MIVAEIMTRDPVVVTPDTTVADARTLCERLEVRHLPVVDHGVVIGMVTARDLWDDDTDVLRVAAGFPPRNGGFEGQSVRAVMGPARPLAQPELSTQTAAQLLLLKHRTGLAVIDQRNRLVGIITASDLRRAVAPAAPSPVDEPGLTLVS